MNLAPMLSLPRELGLPTDLLVDAYYDANRKEFVLRNACGRWLSHSAQQFKMLLKTGGVVTNTDQAEAVIAEIINTRDVAYTGRLAGHMAGFYEANGVRMLVTEGPTLPAAAVGEWPTIARLLQGLLKADPNYGDLQLVTFCLWLQSAYRAVSSGCWRPGQILALAGPIACGKSLLQRLITVCLGGRMADPFRYLSGNTQFNRELFGAEHLVVDDAQASTDYRTRMEMAAHLKAIAVSQDHNCHGKGREAVNLRPIWRCSISLNDEGECLLVLPPLRADIADKLHLLRCHSPEVPFPTETPEAMKEYWEKLVGELPAFLHECLQLKPPPERVDQRFGVKAFHHPDLVMALEEQAPEIVLLELIDLQLWQNPGKISWEGTARDLESVLLGPDSKVREPARRLLSFVYACGTYLGRLAKNQPNRVEKDRSTERRGWLINRPRIDVNR